MDTSTVGRVVVEVKIENLSDVYDVAKGRLAPDQVRTVETSEALVDTGATALSMPRHLIQQLGLEPLRERTARTPTGMAIIKIYHGVRLTIQGRDCITDVAELPDICPVLIGQVPLEQLDFVVEMRSHRLIGNPAHGGEHQLELY